MVDEIKQEQPKSLVDEAKEERIKLEAVLEANKKLLEELNQFKSREILSGKSSAGNIPIQETEDQKIKREMKEIFKGTAVGEFLR